MTWSGGRAPVQMWQLLVARPNSNAVQLSSRVQALSQSALVFAPVLSAHCTPVSCGIDSRLCALSTKRTNDTPSYSWYAALGSYELQLVVVLLELLLMELLVVLLELLLMELLLVLLELLLELMLELLELLVLIVLLLVVLTLAASS